MKVFISLSDRVLQRGFPLPQRRRAHREGKRDTEHFRFWTVNDGKIPRDHTIQSQTERLSRALFVCTRQERDCFAKACPTSAIQPTGPAAATPPSVLPLVTFVHFQNHQCSIDGRKSLSIRSLSAACKLAFRPYAARGWPTTLMHGLLRGQLGSMDDSHAKEGLCG